MSTLSDGRTDRDGRREMKPNRLLNGESLSVPLIHKELSGMRVTHNVDRFPDSQRT